MAGPAIRYWEIAKALSSHHSVTLLTLTRPDINPDGFKVYTLQEAARDGIFKNADVLITQNITHRMAWIAKRYGIRIILDAYDPMPLENLEVFKHHSMSARELHHQSICRQFEFSFRMADGVICANERQKDLWMGLMLGLGKLTPQLYDQCPSLESLLGIVPFGLSSKQPQKTGPGLREKFNIPHNHTVLLWGGGIWNWFDPLTLINAIGKISKTRKDIHLVFMGIKHPNEAIPEMEMCRSAIKLSKDLDLFDKQVHINFGWTPYEERQNFLIDSDIGVSNHFEHLETRYSFRTRVLDYLWAELPMIVTEGDAFAEMIGAKNLGLVVPYCDVDALAKAIIHLSDNPEKRIAMKWNISEVRSDFYWTSVTKPLESMIEQLMCVKPKMSLESVARIIQSKYASRSPSRVFKYLLNRFYPAQVKS